MFGLELFCQEVSCKCTVYSVCFGQHVLYMYMLANKAVHNCHYSLLSSVEIVSLGPLLGQIVVALSSLAETHAAAITEILRYLIVENQ